MAVDDARQQHGAGLRRRDIVGMAHYLDLQLTVPGGAVLPMAGHHDGSASRQPTAAAACCARCTPNCTTASPTTRYPIAGLTASEGGIYGRFGYGPATIEQELTIDRRVARFRDDAPDPGGVRTVRPAEHARRDRGDLRPLAARDAGRPLPAAGIVGRNVRRPREEPLRRDGVVRVSAPRRLRLVSGVRRRGVDVVRVDEVTAGTPEARVALCRALLGLDLMEKVVYSTYPEDPLPYLLTDARAARHRCRGRSLATHHGHPRRARGAPLPRRAIGRTRSRGRIPQ